MAQGFDVFLSHNSRDKPVIRRIAAFLKEWGLQPWLDVDELRPGLPFQDALEEAMVSTRAAAVCLGGHGLGSWQKAEIRALLTLMVEKGEPVIPVLLPGSPENPEIGLMLGQNTWVDLRGGLTETGLDLLYWGITGEKRAPGRRPVPPGPPAHNLPYQSLGELLKGRDGDLQWLASGFAEPSRPMAIVQGNAIHGLGGIGKTRLAVEHAWRCGHQYSAAWFVPADSAEGLRRGLSALASSACLALPERLSAVESDMFGAVVRHLHEHPGWLLIFDNVDTREAASAVHQILPQLTGGRVLITSRLRSWPPTIQRQALGAIALEEAAHFLLTRTAGDRELAADDPAQAARLAEALGGLPLALEQAAAFIVHHQIGLADYFSAWRRQHDEVLSWYDPLVMQYPASVAATWKKTFDQLGPTAAALLRLTAFLAADPISAEMFEEGEELVRESAIVLADETGKELDEPSIPAAFAELAGYSMITRQDGRRLLVHRMVQEVLRSQIPTAARGDWIEQTLGIVDEYAPDPASDVRTWAVWDPLRPHVAALLEHAEHIGNPAPTSRLVSGLGDLLSAKGLYFEAEPLMRRALAVDEALQGPDHPDVANDLSSLARLLQDTNRLAEAEPLLQRALAINQTIYGEDRAELSNDLHNLSLWHQETNHLTEAETLARRSLAMSEAAFGPDHVEISGALHNLSRIALTLNNFAEAESLIRRSLAIDEETFGPQHPEIARDLSILCRLLHDMNRLAEAEPLMRRALAIDESSFGPDHPEVANDLIMLARLLHDTNRLAEAEPMMRRGLAIHEASYGPDHPGVANGLVILASLLHDTNRTTEAEPLLRRALAIDEASYGPDHPEVARDLFNLARLFQDTNRLAEAEPLMRRALVIGEDSYGPDHPEVASHLVLLARLLQDTNRLAEAEPLLRQALAIDEASYGSDHPEVASDLAILARLLQDTNRLAEAELMMRRALAIDEASYGSDHPEVASHLVLLARLLQDTNRLAEAEPMMRRGLAIHEASYGPDHPTVANGLVNLASLLHDTNRTTEAEPLLRRALAIDEASYGPDHPEVARDLFNLARLFQDTNRLAEAEPLMRRALVIGEDSYGPDHPEVASHLVLLARLLQDTNRLAEAEPLLRQALAIDEASYGSDHPEVATDLECLALLLLDKHKVSEAVPLAQRALAIDEATYAEDHPNVARDLGTLARGLLETHRTETSEPLVVEAMLLRALEILERSLGPDHPKTVKARESLEALRERAS